MDSNPSSPLLFSIATVLLLRGLIRGLFFMEGCSNLSETYSLVFLLELGLEIFSLPTCRLRGMVLMGAE